MTDAGRDQAIAVLEPPLSAAHCKIRPTEEYVQRFRDAVWAGLGIEWVTDGNEVIRHSPPRKPKDWPDIARKVELAVTASAKRWGRIHTSRDAEREVRPAVHEALRTLDFEKTSRKFASFWRTGVADAAWERTCGDTRRVALEVKLDEDIMAPFGQIMDDLGAFDAVIQVRVLANTQTAKQVDALIPPKLIKRIERALPVAMLKVRVPRS